MLCELGSALLLFGALIHQPQLLTQGNAALAELQALGYRVPDSEDPVRVYPAKTGTAFSTVHAGGWAPGVIALRPAPAGNLGPAIYLRHELMHEASHRTCAGRMPVWAEEAAAMQFSGELAGQGAPAASPSEAELAHLREQVRIGAVLDPSSYRTLGRMVALYGWPRSPCAASEPISALLRPKGGMGGFSALLISLYSGRALEAHGDQDSRFPPGSLLKIPYAAALEAITADDRNQAIGRELARSDTQALLARRQALALDRYAWFTAIVPEAPLNRQLAGQPQGPLDDRDWRALLGERDREGRYPLEASLPELARLLRAALLARPERFAGLAANGTLAGSTLAEAPKDQRSWLGKLHALSKTGTASDHRGLPLAGHLMVAWPGDDPRYLAIFRAPGENGAGCLRHAERLLGQWSRRYPAATGLVRVRLMSLLPRDSWSIVDLCPSLERGITPAGRLQISVCGEFVLLSNARGSRSERQVAGVLEHSADNRQVVLLTDHETYADGVLAAEAQDLTGAAREALRAVIVWNGLRGSHRHPESRSLCDSTHCMAFQGHPEAGPSQRGVTTAPELLGLLDTISKEKKLDWLPFSEGGSEGWEKRLPAAELLRIVDEPALLDLRRERGRNGEVNIHLLYPESEETIACEVFRSRLKLPSCPESIRFDAASASWTLAGIGKGHGLGLSVDRARTLARAGSDAAAILKDAYQGR